jgi:hypothetical protein
MPGQPHRRQTPVYVLTLDSQPLNNPCRSHPAHSQKCAVSCCATGVAASNIPIQSPAMALGMEKVTAMFSPRLYEDLSVTTFTFELIGFVDGLTVDDGLFVGDGVGFCTRVEDFVRKRLYYTRTAA